MLDLRNPALPRHPARRRRPQLGQELGGAPLQPLEPRLMLAADVLTYHNNLSRTGSNPLETELTPANVNVNTFGKVGQVRVDGQVYAQPLYKSNVLVPGRGVHNVVYVATAHDSVYAFDSDNLSLLWFRNFTNPASGITTVPKADVLDDAFGDEIGIMGTPVIDPASNTLYVVTRTRTVSAPGAPPVYAQQLQALDLGTGSNKLGSPTTIQATVRGTGDGAVAGRLSFDPHWQLQRSGLLLSNGIVYVAWASHATHDPYHGWLMGFNARTLRLVSVLVTTPDARRGGIWMSGGAPAGDAQGNIYLSVGNGTFDADEGGRDFGDSVLKIRTKLRRRNTLKIVDYFTPSNESFLDTFDRDLGSGGVVLLPDQNGFVRQELVAGGKEGTIFLLNRDFLGRHSAFGNNVVQEIPAAMNQQYDTPAYFNGRLYYVPTGKQKPGRPPNALLSFNVNNGLITSAQAGKPTYGYPGSTPSVSSNGVYNGIVWTLDNGNSIWGPSILRAYDANNVRRLLYESSQAGTRDVGGTAIKFSVPTVANGRVFVGGTGFLTVYGLLGQR